jgi:ABC-type polysaccharide/polyol phosphate export systems, permease component
MGHLIRDFMQGFRHARFWAFSAWLDVVVNSRMSRLGVLWLLLPSFLYIWGVGSFFAVLQMHTVRDFAIYIAVGTVVFRLATGVMIESASAFKTSQAFIMDGHVRLVDFVLRVVAKHLFTFMMSLPAAAIAIAIYPNVDVLGLVMGICLLPLVMINVLWIGVLFSLAGARYPDLSQLIPNIFMFLYLLTPIIWSAASVPPNSLRGQVIIFNPLYYLIEVVRAPIVQGRLDLHAVLVVTVMAVVGWAVAALAYRRWARFVPIWL